MIFGLKMVLCSRWRSRKRKRENEEISLFPLKGRKRGIFPFSVQGRKRGLYKGISFPVRPGMEKGFGALPFIHTTGRMGPEKFKEIQRGN
jgi:hypothetical protein